MTLLEDARHELRQVVLDMELAQVLRHPAPTFHVDDQALRLRAGRGGCELVRFHAAVERRARARRQDAVGLDVVLLLERAHRILHLQVVDVLRAAGQRQVEPLAQDCDLRMLAAELEARPVGGQPRAGFRLHRLGGGVPAAGFQQGLAQPLELLVLRVQVAQVVAGRLGRRQRLQHHLRIAQARLLIEVLADLRRIEAASACMPGILESGEPQFDLCTGQRVRCRGALRELRQLEGRCRQSPVVGLADFSHGVAGLGREAITRHPKQGLVARCIERGERGTVRALDIALGRLGEQPAHLGEQRVDGRRRWRRIGDRRRGWRRAARTPLAASAGWRVGLRSRREAWRAVLGWLAVEAKQPLPAAQGEEEWRLSLPVQPLSAAGQHSTARQRVRRVPSAQRLVRRRSVRAQGGQRGRPRSRSQFVSTSENLSKLARKPTDRWVT